MMEEILKYLPKNISELIQKEINKNPEKEIINQAIELRIRINRPIIIRLIKSDIVLNYRIKQNDIINILEKICENSIYAYKAQLIEGYITIYGGHRVGITGRAVIENGKIINLKYISGLNFRIAREVFGCSNKVLQEILDIKNNTIFNTLILSPPGRGKTTILRDCIRQISNGIPSINFKGKNCSIVDERGELAAMYKGIPQNDIGLRTDVLENISKSEGIKMLIRSMGPEIIGCDEIGSKEDIEAIKYALSAGVKGIFTMHAKKIEDTKKNKEISELIENNIIEKIIILENTSKEEK